jgi:hypothetical protein
MRIESVLAVSVLALLVVGTPGWAAGQAAGAAMDQAVAQLGHAIGEWSVVTEFLDAEGKVARKVAGTYHFEWVVPDRVVRGRSDIPVLIQSSGILVYVNSAGKTIEMVSVGADGQLFTMTGPLDAETRYSQTFKTPDGTDMQLRFTRSHVTPDRFESRMERTVDGGKTWLPGNHQVFTRVK